MPMTFLLCLQRSWLFVLLAGLGLEGSALAESGSAQATMALIVPPNTSNMAALEPSSESSPYVADASAIVMEQGEHVMYKVWISI